MKMPNRSAYFIVSTIVIGIVVFTVGKALARYEEGENTYYDHYGRPRSRRLQLSPGTDLSEYGLTKKRYFSTESITAEINYRNPSRSYSVPNPIKIEGEKGEGWLFFPSLKTWFSSNRKKSTSRSSQASPKTIPDSLITELMARKAIPYLQPRTYTLEDMKVKNENNK